MFIHWGPWRWDEYVEGDRGGEDDSMTLPNIATISAELIHPSEETDHSRQSINYISFSLMWLIYTV